MPARLVAHCAEKTDAYQPAREQFEALLLTLQAPKAQEMTHDGLEQLLLTEQRELMRRCLQGHLDQRGKGVVSAPVIDACGQAHRHQRSHTRQTVERVVAESAAKESFDEVLKTLDSYTGAKVPKRQAKRSRVVRRRTSTLSTNKSAAGVSRQPPKLVECWLSPPTAKACR
jgi:hypothetical protein